MNAWNYHNSSFQIDLRRFFDSLERGPRERNIGDGIVRDPRYSFHVEDLLYDADHPDHLAHIRPEHLAFFAASLTYVVLINQIVHAHFRQLHDEFWRLTRYPLVAGGMNPTKSPYCILSDEIWTKRRIRRAQIMEAWQGVMRHFHEDMRVFESNQAPRLGLTWDAFRNAALNDRDVVTPEPWGPIARTALQ